MSENANAGVAIKEAIRKAVEGIDLGRSEAAAAMDEIMSGRCTGAQIGAFLTAMRLKGESVEEIAGFAQVMRDKAERVAAPAGAVDIVGTGGDGAKTFNVSTLSSLIAAAAGAKVAKHGNRSVSSTSGAADALAALGVNLEADTATLEKCLAEAGICFMFAPRMHGAMKHAIGPRREIGVRTFFNILGPLTNPAGAKRLVVGVYASKLAPVVALVLKQLGAERVMAVHGHDGLDEISVSDETTVAELKNGGVEEYVIAPEEFGLSRGRLAELVVQSPAESAAIIRGVLAGKRGPARDIALLNAGAALAVAGVAEDMAAGVELAAAALDSGKAEAKLAELVRLSNDK